MYDSCNQIQPVDNPNSYNKTIILAQFKYGLYFYNNLPNQSNPIPDSLWIKESSRDKNRTWLRWEWKDKECTGHSNTVHLKRIGICLFLSFYLLVWSLCEP